MQETKGKLIPRVLLLLLLLLFVNFSAKTWLFATSVEMYHFFCPWVFNLLASKKTWAILKGPFKQYVTLWEGGGSNIVTKWHMWEKGVNQFVTYYFLYIFEQNFIKKVFFARWKLSRHTGWFGTMSPNAK